MATSNKNKRITEKEIKSKHDVYAIGKLHNNGNISWSHHNINYTNEIKNVCDLIKISSINKQIQQSIENDIEINEKKIKIKEHRAKLSIFKINKDTKLILINHDQEYEDILNYLLYKHIINNVENGIIVIEEKNNLLFYNNNAHKILEFYLGTPEKITKEYLIQSFIDSAVQKESIEIKIENDAYEEKTINFNLNRTTYLNKEYIIIEFKDITKEKQNKINQNISEEEIKKFAYIASHDLKEPLRQIYNFIELLEESLVDKLNEEEKEYIRFIKKNSKKSIDLTHGLLNFAKPIDLTKNIQEINAESLIENVIEIHKLNIKHKNIEIIKHSPFPFLITNPIFPEQIFSNLISNSIKFSKKNEKNIIEIGSYYDTQIDNIIFYIKDNGIGISKKNTESLFIPFKKMHNNPEYDGTGLGLSICKKIINKMKGEIWHVPSQKGCEFRFYIGKKYLKSEML